MIHPIEAHGGILRNLYLDAAEVTSFKAQAQEYPSWDLTPRQLCDLELLLNGGFSPLDGFLNQADYDRVVAEMRLGDGTLWPIPITLDVSEAFADQIGRGGRVALRDAEGVFLAVLEVGDIWRPDPLREARQVFGTDDDAHPGVFHLRHRTGPVYVGGRLHGIEPPTHYDFPQWRDSPRELRDRFVKLGWRRVVAFQTRNPMHRIHQALTLRAVQRTEAGLLIHPAVGATQPGDVDHYARVRCYEHLLRTYPERTTMLSLLNLAMRMAGPREALWHAIIRQNHGCTHFIVGRDHAGPGSNPRGRTFYDPYAAQQLALRHQDELDIRIVPFPEMVYVRERAGYLPASEVQAGETVLNLSGTEFRRRLREGLEIPDWFSYPEVVAELRRIHPPRHRQGFTVFFTGLSGSGKSTIANALRVKLLELGERPVTLLDGDIVRKHLSSELSFSREHRNLNILRIGYVASEITKNGGIAICAPIAPYTATRRQVREMIAPLGGFIEVHVATPLETCEARDRKGLYAKARVGLLKEFTGISDPYEAPEHPDLVIDTRDCGPGEAAQRVLLKLESLGFIRDRP
ncbi:MAG: bifunctional sulfate adenylyltransferase/adenylylsulfate kinase [Candidatus Contendobacter sp.]|nr:bifunctional sulfate adenylyltransferase/adenylylsulfate kinase [Candidatus Contendobacter sp.]MDG4559477.1 bifunctional sulfate adenylyltransferase/adenylylsulfate kinase [Candidatus Contendobacter sp.]